MYLSVCLLVESCHNQRTKPGHEQKQFGGGFLGSPNLCKGVSVRHVVVVVVVVVSSSLARFLGECSTIHSLPALLQFF